MSEFADMKNIQVIDGAEHAGYDIFSATEEEFALISPEGQDIAFIDEVLDRKAPTKLGAALEMIWKRRIPKCKTNEIHGLLLYGQEKKKVLFHF